MLAVPNVSEGRDQATLRRDRRRLRPRPDPPVERSRSTTARSSRSPAPGELHQAVLAGAQEAIARIDIHAHARHPPARGRRRRRADRLPRPTSERGAACAEALVLADELGQLGVPVYLYGELAGGRTRAELRSDLSPLRARLRPAEHPTAGATLVAARPPLVAFNVEIDAPLADREGDRARAAHHARRARARAAGRARPGLDQHRERAHDGRGGRGGPTRTRPSPAPSSSRPPRAPRSRTSRTTSRSEPRNPSRIIYSRRRHGPDEAQEADQAPRQCRGLDRGTRPHRPQAHGGGAEGGRPHGRSRPPAGQAAVVEQRRAEGARRWP